jgi:rhomboid protease GluP
MDCETALRVTRDHKLADDWALVLETQGLSPRVRATLDGLVLSVPNDEVERALDGLSAYEKENPSREQEQESTPAKSPNLIPGLIVAGVLVVSHFITVGCPHIAPWFERGAADAERILAGELWRTVTALTLHADLGHLLSNAIAAAIFVTILASMVGPGLSVLLLIMAGAGGNLANASLQGPGHLAIGASTAIFGIIGAVGGFGVLRRQKKSDKTRRAWISIAAAIALLAMLGTGTGRVDVLAHFFGFLFGVVAGVIVAFILPHRAGPARQWLCGTIGIIVLFYCWILALS